MPQFMSDDPYLARLRGLPADKDMAIQALYRVLGPRIRRYALRNQLPDDAANDVVQQSFVVAIDKLASFRGDSSVTTWIWGIARNVLLEQLRARKLSNSFSSIGPDNGDDENTGGSEVATHPNLSHWPSMEDSLCLQEALVAFAREYPERALALEFLVQGWTMPELARHLGRTESATRQYVSECRRKLAPFIKPCLDCDDQKHLDRRRKEGP